MRWLLLVLGLVWLALVPVPAFSQTSHGGSSSAQYDQYPSPGSGVGGLAAHGAIVASGAISEEAAGGNSVSAAELSNVPSERDAGSSTEAQDESANTSDLEKLPHTGGPSFLWLFGAPLICAGGILARRVLSA